MSTPAILGNNHSTIIFGTTTATATAFIFPGQSKYSFSGTESLVNVTWRTAGTFSNLYTRVIGNGIPVATTITFRVNDAAGNETVSIGSKATGEFIDSVNTDVVASGSKVNIQQVTSTASGNITETLIDTLFTPTSGLMSKFVNCLGAGLALSSQTTTSYFGPMGGLGTNANESIVQIKAKTTGSLGNLFVNVPSNTRVTASTVRSRINTANGSMSVSIGSAATGIFEDLVNTDPIAPGTVFNYQSILGTGTGSILKLSCISSEFFGQSNPVFAAPSTTVAIGSNLTQFCPISGDTSIVSGASEVNVQTKANTTYTASNLACLVTNNGISANPSTVSFRINGTTATQQISIGTSATGFFEDAVDTDVVAATNELDYIIVTGSNATGANISFAHIGHWMVFPSGVSPIHLLTMLGVGG